MNKISFDKINVNTGTITLKLNVGNIFDKNYSSIRIFQIIKNNVVFILERHNNFFRFIQSKPNKKSKICKIPVDYFIKAKKLFIGMTWTEKENKLYISIHSQKNSGELKISNSIESNIKFRITKDGNIFQLGDENVTIGNYLVCKNNKIILHPMAGELLDFQLERIEIIISNCKISEKGFLFEITLVQQTIVMMATLFETYLRERFYELCKERNISIDILLELIPKKIRTGIKNDCFDISKKENKNILEVFLLDKKQINFQNWDRSKKAFNRIFNIRFGDLGLNNYELERVQIILYYRHKIVHSSKDMTILNIEKLPPDKPIFANKKFGEESFKIIKKFLLTLQEKSLKK